MMTWDAMGSRLVCQLLHTHTTLCGAIKKCYMVEYTSRHSCSLLCFARLGSRSCGWRTTRTFRSCWWATRWTWRNGGRWPWTRPRPAPRSGTSPTWRRRPRHGATSTRYTHHPCHRLLLLYRVILIAGCIFPLGIIFANSLLIKNLVHGCV